MDFGWTPEQRERQEAMLARVSEAFASHPPGGGLTLKNWRTLGDLGLLGLCVPARYGGGGLGALETAGMMEAFGRGCPDTGIVFAASAHLYACAMPVLRHGSDLIKEQMLPRLCSGEWIARQRHDRVGRWLRCIPAVCHRRACARRLPAQRREKLREQRSGGGPLRDVRDH